MSAPSWNIGDEDNKLLVVQVTSGHVWFHVHDYNYPDERHWRDRSMPCPHLVMSFAVPLPPARKLVKFLRKNLRVDHAPKHDVP